MRVGYVLKCFPRLSETFILTEILALERRGIEVTVFRRYRPETPVPHAALGGLRAEVVDLGPMLQERLFEPFEIHRDLALRFARTHERLRDAALAYRDRQEIRYWLLAACVASHALKRRLDLLHAHFATGNASIARYAGGIVGIPYTFTAHAKDIYANDVSASRLRSVLEEASTAITISDANREHLAAVAPNARIRRIYNGLDLSLFETLPTPPRPDPPLVLAIARMVEKKGLADLLAAVAHLDRSGRTVRCRIVGDGPLDAELRRRAAELGIAHLVELTGSVSQEEIATRHLPETSVFALPCIVAADGDRDGVPTTLLEAMARGVPVVSTRLPGIPEAVPDGEAGLLADPGDVPGIAAAIRRTLDDPEATRRRAGVARRHVETLFDSARNAETLHAVLAESATRRPAARETRL